MAVPDFQSLMRPVLAAAADGLEHNINEVIARLAAEFRLTDEELDEMQPSGRQTVFMNRVHWARTYLDKAGAIARTRRSHFKITERGKQLLATCPSRVDVKALRQFPEFVAFHSRSPSSGTSNDTQTSDAQAQQPDEETRITPEEAIQSAEEEIAASLRSQLLARIAELSPTFFEGLVVDLIVAMGYGGTRQSVARRLGKSGDEGIDGVVNEDPLGLDTVYIQAKRYAPDNTVGREKIQQFAGALVGQSAAKGVFVTTSSFTKQAQDYASRVPQRIVLIGGDDLARLMVQYGVGVRTERVVEIKRIDLDYFDPSGD